MEGRGGEGRGGEGREGREGGEGGRDDFYTYSNRYFQQQTMVQVNWITLPKKPSIRQF